MTEYWKSHAMHWCDVCKCWLNDNKAAILHHERGAKHQENLARKLRDMSKKADAEKKMKADADKAINKIEEAAAKQYEEDLKALQEAVGHWTWDEGAGYYYNEAQRWYYDPKTQWYYGGEPAEWVQLPPSLPQESRFGVAPHTGGPEPQRPAGSTSTATASTSSRPASAAPAATAAPPGTKVVKKVVALPSHPMAQLGGSYQPTVGRMGAAKGITAAAPSTSAPGSSSGGAAAAKRKLEEVKGKDKPLSAEEEAARARREAARQRVALRTAQGFGYV
mmetsp:Transcript_21125/g.46262  ORF Transcript_21125/g.46262 Transcript_21125/m.46262 type:complete len:277 (-) Transcript_21125:385-1215(-)|eukprot:CAMPEP_0202918764 /NCGR_PEP_ID=MMETSP1392-20130828/74210_1 /ASSEMBLY_ACC=CAM_ASM_000868 /TAXON_ID=225041 /ORGANISM="Chlamydomonas chlamydogama, Strain SAG 11-48b" /LENGTH=276 /DNA_ID=CAMNT_0049611915 /DNA_START=72 /DNA_END=902 /DNA_ORIENTATION=-